MRYLNTPAAFDGWTDADSDAARLALELECLLLDKDMPTSTVSRWWSSAHEALDLHRRRLTDAQDQAAPDDAMLAARQGAIGGLRDD